MLKDVVVELIRKKKNYYLYSFLPFLSFTFLYFSSLLPFSSLFLPSLIALLSTAATTTITASPSTYPVLLYTTFSWGGLRGNITFSWGGLGTNVTIEAAVEVADGVVADSVEPQEYNWGIHEFPVRYDTDKRCGLGEVGAR